jgi:hypothetical protein
MKGRMEQSEEWNKGLSRYKKERLARRILEALLNSYT